MLRASAGAKNSEDFVGSIDEHKPIDGVGAGGWKPERHSKSASADRGLRRRGLAGRLRAFPCAERGEARDDGEHTLSASIDHGRL